MLRKILYCCTLFLPYACIPSPYVAAQNLELPADQLVIDRDTVEGHFFGLENAVRLTGEIQSFVGDETFVLDTPAKDISVNYFGLDIEEEDIALLRQADKVTVYGTVEDSFFDEHALKARIIYIRNGNRSTLFQ